MEGEEKKGQHKRISKYSEEKRDWFKDWHIIWTVPDGERTGEKAEKAVTLSAFLGVTAGIFRAFLGPTGSKKLGFLPRLGVYCSIVGPNIVAAAAYVYATSYAAKVRGKSEAHNHAFGGAAAGAILGLRSLSLLKVTQRSILFGISGVLAAQLGSLPAFEPIRSEPEGKHRYLLLGFRSVTPTNLEHEKE